MKTMELQITAKSDVFIGSGEGWGAAIDSDIVFDDCGLPYIPAKRIKGCLRESALEISEMFELSNKGKIEMDNIFGKKGVKNSLFSFENLFLEEYEINKSWLKWGIYKYPGMLSKETIVSELTSIRQQTSIDTEKGTAKEHSLRTIRAIDKNTVFVGKIYMPDTTDLYDLEFLDLAAKNLHYIGTKRNRGFGFVDCKILGLPEVNTFTDRLGTEKQEAGNVSNKI